MTEAEKYNDNFWKKLQKEFRKYENQLVIYTGYYEVVRFIGIENVPGDDFFYEFKTLKGKVFQSSCLIDFIPLKGKIDKKEYDRMEDQWELNKDTWN